jgi:O-antigen ligase
MGESHRRTHFSIKKYLRLKEIILKYNTKVVFLLFAALAILPILPRVVESILIAVMVLVSAISFIVDDETEWSIDKTKTLVYLSIFFSIATITLIYTENIKNGIQFVQRLLPLVLFPIVIMFNKKSLLTNEQINNIKYIYITSILLFLIIIQILLLNKSNLSFYYWRKSFEEITKVHGTYFSIWIGFAIILLTFLFKEFQKKRIKLALLIPLIILYFLYWQYLIGARMPFLATVLFLIVFNCFQVKNWIVFVAIGIIVLGVIYSKKDGLSDRFTGLINYTFTFPKGQYSMNHLVITSEQIRNGIYFCSYQKIKEAPLIGYGIGDVDDQLQNCYDEEFTDTDTYKILNYNSHNQYLNVLLVSGLIGFLLMIFHFKFLLNNAFRKKNKLYLSFLFFMLLNFCFENVLSRHDGIFFFSFFNTILFFQREETI